MDVPLPQNIMRRMNDFRKEGKYCDIAFAINQRRFYAHRCILASAGDNFTNMFNLDLMSSSLTTNVPIELNDVDQVGFELLLQYLYSGDIVVNKSVLENVIRIAHYFRIAHLMNKCIDVVRFILNVEHNADDLVLQYHNLAIAIDCDSLKNRTTEYIRHNFSTVFSSDELLDDVTFDVLMEFVTSDLVCVDDEAIVFDVIERWIERNRSQRTRYIGDLLKHVRFAFVEPDYMREYVRNCRLIIDNRRDIDLVGQIASGDIPASGDRSVTSRPRDKRRYIYMFGHDATTTSRDIVSFRYDGRVYGVQVTGDDMRKRGFPKNTSFKMTVCNGSVYMYTLERGLSAHSRKTFSMFERNSDRWNELNTLKIYHRLESFVALERYDCLYANLNSDTHQIHCYPIENDRWDLLEAARYNIRCSEDDLIDHRFYLYKACLVSGADGNVIYSFGGTDYGGRPLNVALLFDPRVGHWRYVEPMPEENYRAAGVAYDYNRIFVTGGTIGSRPDLNVVQEYDVRANRWKLSESMKLKRSSHSLVVYLDLIYAIGGSAVPLIEIYDPYRNTWTDGPSMVGRFYDNEMIASVF